MQRRLVAHSYKRRPTEIAADVRTFAPYERWRRAASAAGLLAAAGLVCLPIPILHFVASPILLVASVVVGAQRLREVERYERVMGPCPACAHVTELPLPSRTRLPFTLPCPICGEFMWVAEPA
jgi:hypothetical protein